MNKSFVFWSNLSFLLPLGLALYFDIGLSAVLIAATMLLSFAYHSKKGNKFRGADGFAASLLILSNLRLCYLGNFSSPYFEIAVVLVLLAFYFFISNGKDQELHHGLWHVASALITTFSLLTFYLAT